MEEYDINLDSALTAAVEAARKAGSIMSEFYRSRREAIASSSTRRGPPPPSAETTALHPTNDPPLSGLGKSEETLQVEFKECSTDLVTRYDKLCDETIMNILKRFNTTVEREKHEAGLASFSFAFITEELTPDAPLTDAPTWIVDPIDGTMSFVHGSCDCCVSIGLTIKKVPVLAVIYCPFLAATRSRLPVALSSTSFVGELYTAIRGKGAFLNGHPLHVLVDATPKSSVVAFNYPTVARLSHTEKDVISAKGDTETFKKDKLIRMVNASGEIRRKLVMHPVQGIRSYCACALTLAQVAAGRIDLQLEAAGKSWDVCAGSLLVSEAGGVVKNMWGDAFGLEGTTTIVAGANAALVDLGVDLCKSVQYGDFWRP